MGGTFNPIHSGHLKAAELVMKKIPMEKILFIPSYVPPHKEIADMVGPFHRLRMVELAVAGNPAFEASSLEMDAEGTSYSVFTLEKIRISYPQATIFFIMGIDAFLEIKTWKEYKKVLKQCSFIIMNRPGYCLEDAKYVLGKKYSRNIHEYQDDQKLLDVMDEKPHILLLPMLSLDVSSTDIRHLFAAKKEVQGLVPESVLAYIRKHKLYQVMS